MSAEEVAKAFVQHFYQAFDGGADQLAGLFVSSLFARGPGRPLFGGRWRRVVVALYQLPRGRGRFRRPREIDVISPPFVTVSKEGVRQ